MSRPKSLPIVTLADNGYYYAVGTGVEKSLKTKELEEAHRIYALWLPRYLGMASAAANDDKVAPRTVHWCLDYYGKHHVPTMRSVKSRENTIKTLAMWRKHFPASYMVDSINDATFNEWKELRRNATKTVTRNIFKDGRKLRGLDGKAIKRKVTLPAAVQGSQLKDNTLLREMRTLRTALNYAIKQKRMLSTDLMQFAMPEPNAVEKRRLTEDEGLALLRQFKTMDPGKGREGCLPFLFLAGVLTFGTGSRITAAAELEWDRVDFDRMEIDFRTPGKPHTDKLCIPDAPIQDWMLPLLKQAHAERFKGGASGRYVCGKVQSWGGSFARHAAKAGLFAANGKTGVGPHTFRHTYISLTLQGGASIWELSEQVQCSVATLEGHYGRATKATKKALANKALDQKKMRSLSLEVVEVASA